MKEINAAYDEIQKMRASGKRSESASGFNPGTDTGDARFADVRRLINEGQIDVAERILLGMSRRKRTPNGTS